MPALFETFAGQWLVALNTSHRLDRLLTKRVGMIGLALGARANLSNEPNRKTRVLIVSGTLVRLLSYVYLIMFLSPEQVGIIRHALPKA
jgi:hypothetical protein